jgi:Fe2+ transport system protein B
MSLEAEMVERRYKVIEEIVRKTVQRKPPTEELTDRIDKIVLNKALGLPILFALYAVIFYMTF